MSNEQCKHQCNLDRPTAHISALSSVNVGKYEYLSGKYILPGKLLLEKAAAIKRFEYSSFGNELKKETDPAKNYYMLFKDQINVNHNIKKVDV